MIYNPYYFLIYWFFLKNWKHCRLKRRNIDAHFLPSSHHMEPCHVAPVPKWWHSTHCHFFSLYYFVIIPFSFPFWLGSLSPLFLWQNRPATECFQCVSRLPPGEVVPPGSCSIRLVYRTNWWFKSVFFLFLKFWTTGVSTTSTHQACFVRNLQEYRATSFYPPGDNKSCGVSVKVRFSCINELRTRGGLSWHSKWRSGVVLFAHSIPIPFTPTARPPPHEGHRP